MPTIGNYSLLFALFVAATLLFFGHLVRVIRWRGILLHSHLDISNSMPLVSLAIGYFVNLIIPFRLGEIVRSGLLAYLTKFDFILILATVVFERAIDFAVLGFLILLLIHGENHGFEAAAVFFLASLTIFSFSFLTRYSSNFRKIILQIAGIFNPVIKTLVLHFVWSLEGLWFENKMLFRMKFWYLTLVMWFVYGASIYALSISTATSFEDIFAQIYLLPINQSILTSFSDSAEQTSIILLYLISPLIFVILFSKIFNKRKSFNIRAVVSWITSPERYISISPDVGVPRFNSFDNYRAYLERKFGTSKTLIKEFEDAALDGLVVHRLFLGGSGAVTALVETSSKMLVRKYASSELADNLSYQYSWIKAYKHSLPLVNLDKQELVSNGIYYDMEFNGSAREFYEVIHTSDVRSSINLLQDILETMHGFHSNNILADGDDSIIRSYVETKVCQNFKLLKEFLPEIFELNELTVNGRSFPIKLLSVFENSSWFLSKFKISCQSVIHGDLTVENILVLPQQGDRYSWFLIDPNPRNKFSSPLIDYAKLFQSLHFGYESLNRNPQTVFIGNSLTVHLHISTQYRELYQFLISFICEKYGSNFLMEVYLHEIINYLRLIPYQAHKDVKRTYAFFGVLCLLLHEFRNKYPESFDD